MRKITRYQSDDGKEWPTARDCLKYESICAKVDEIMSRLKPAPTKLHKPVQQDKQAILDVAHKLAVVAVTAKPSSFKEGESVMSKDMRDFGGIFFDEHAPIARAYRRLIQIDTGLQEWTLEGYQSRPTRKFPARLERKLNP